MVVSVREGVLDSERVARTRVEQKSWRGKRVTFGVDMEPADVMFDDP